MSKVKRCRVLHDSVDLPTNHKPDGRAARGWSNSLELMDTNQPSEQTRRVKFQRHVELQNLYVSPPPLFDSDLVAD